MWTNPVEFGGVVGGTANLMLDQLVLMAQPTIPEVHTSLESTMT